jgi:quinol-cytochrome oxidoreductase complex cytochrome b subunit
MADPQGPPKKLSLVREYLDEVVRIENERRAKKRFRNVEGFPFWPHEFVRDMIIFCFLMAVMFALSGFIPYYLEAPADPSGQPQVILPDWYLLWSYGLLKIAVDVQVFGVTLVTAKVLGVLLNGVVIAPLILAPFIHPGHSRRPVEDPLWAGFGAAGVMLAFTLSAYSVNGVIYPKVPALSNIKFGEGLIGQGELGAWLTVLLPILTFFLAYVPLKWRQSKLHYENKLSRNYFRIR